MDISWFSNPSRLVKCGHCDIGVRSVVGNCVACGCGPAPYAVEPLPKTFEGKHAAVDWQIANPDKCMPFGFDWDKAVALKE